MQSRIACIALVVVGLSSMSQPATAEIVDKTGTFGGLKVSYKVVLPTGYDAARAYPAVLVFTGGPQAMRGVEGTLEADWRREAERRGYIIVSPASPDGSLFFQKADRIFPEFLDQIQKDYKVQGKLRVAGHSNGGISAFHIAAKHPQYFSTVIGYPGLLDGPDVAKMQALKPMCIFMHGGDQDPGWTNEMQKQAEDLKKKGFKVRMTVEKNQVHRLKAQEIDLSNRLFAEIESCK